jgi:hypothetical protein
MMLKLPLFFQVSRTSPYDIFSTLFSLHEKRKTEKIPVQLVSNENDNKFLCVCGKMFSLSRVSLALVSLQKLPLEKLLTLERKLWKMKIDKFINMAN